MSKCNAVINNSCKSVNCLTALRYDLYVIPCNTSLNIIPGCNNKKAVNRVALNPHKNYIGMCRLIGRVFARFWPENR